MLLVGRRYLLGKHHDLGRLELAVVASAGAEEDGCAFFDVGGRATFSSAGGADASTAGFCMVGSIGAPYDSR